MLISSGSLKPFLKSGEEVQILTSQERPSSGTSHHSQAYQQVMPRHLFHIDLVCLKQGCDGKLTNAGVHQKTCMVLDVDSCYNMAGEYLSCQKCSKKVIFPFISFTFRVNLKVIILYLCTPIFIVVTFVPDHFPFIFN